MLCRRTAAHVSTSSYRRLCCRQGPETESAAEPRKRLPQIWLLVIFSSTKCQSCKSHVPARPWLAAQSAHLFPCSCTHHIQRYTHTRARVNLGRESWPATLRACVSQSVWSAYMCQQNNCEMVCRETLSYFSGECLCKSLRQVMICAYIYTCT